ncbi:MAG: hypothetical protein WD206_01825 [Actinomycetota bacterium]
MIDALIASTELPFLEQGAVQFILFSIMLVLVYLLLKITIAK